MKQKFTIRLEPGDLARLGEVAEAAGVSRSELMRAIMSGSRLRDIRVHRKYNRELLHALNGIMGDIHQIAQDTDTRKWPGMTVLERLNDIKGTLGRIYRAETQGRDDR